MERRSLIGKLDRILKVVNTACVVANGILFKPLVYDMALPYFGQEKANIISIFSAAAFAAALGVLG